MNTLYPHYLSESDPLEYLQGLCYVHTAIAKHGVRCYLQSQITYLQYHQFLSRKSPNSSLYVVPIIQDTIAKAPAMAITIMT